MWLFCRFQGLSAHSPNYDFLATHSRRRCLRFGSRVPCPRIGWSHGRTLKLWGFQGNKPNPWVDWNHVQISKSWGLRAAKRLPMSYCRKAQRSKSQGHQETWPDSMNSWKNSQSVWSVGHLGVAHNPTLDWNAFQMLTPQDCGGEFTWFKLWLKWSPNAMLRRFSGRYQTTTRVCNRLESLVEPQPKVDVPNTLQKSITP